MLDFEVISKARSWGKSSLCWKTPWVNRMQPWKTRAQRWQVTRFISNSLADLTSSHVREIPEGKATISVRHEWVSHSVIPPLPTRVISNISSAGLWSQLCERRSALPDLCRSLCGESGSHDRSKLMRATKGRVVKLNYYLLAPSAILVSFFVLLLDSLPYLDLPSSHLEDVLVSLVFSFDLIDPRPTHRRSPSQNQIDQFFLQASRPSKTWSPVCAFHQVYHSIEKNSISSTSSRQIYHTVEALSLTSSAGP